MNKRILILLISVLAVIFLAAQTCTSAGYDYDCNDGIKSLGEKGIDCGGRYCDACEDDTDTGDEDTYDETVEDADGDGIVDADDFCDGEDDTIDEDNDGVPDCTDDIIDSDNDGVADAEDVCEDLNDNVDKDGDKIPDCIDDSDDDGLTDYEEAVVYKTSPINNDTDDDGLLDGDEVNTYGTDPNEKDSDEDGYTDSREVLIAGTDPLDWYDRPAEEIIGYVLSEDKTTITIDYGYKVFEVIPFEGDNYMTIDDVWMNKYKKALYVRNDQMKKGIGLINGEVFKEWDIV